MYPLLPVLPITMNNQSLKTLITKIERSQEFNESAILNQFGDEFGQHFEVSDETQAGSRKNQKNKSTTAAKVENSNWTNWTNFNYLHVSKKQEGDTYTPSHKQAILENRRQFYFDINGNEDSLNKIVKYLLWNLNSSNPNKQKTSKALLLLYYWFENSNQLQLLTKISIQTDLDKVRKSLETIFDGTDEELKAMALRILFIGWEALNSDLEQQLHWFYKLYNVYKEKPNELFSPILDLNILNIDKTNPFYLLQQKLSLGGSLMLINNFHKINTVKFYQLFDNEFSNSDKVPFIMKPQIYNVNNKNVCFPLYLVLIGKKFTLINPEIDAVDPDSKDSLLGGMKRLLSNKASDPDAPISDIKASFDKYLERNNIAIERTHPFSFSPVKDDFHEYLSYVPFDKLNVYRKSLYKFPISNVQENNNEQFLKTASNEFWSFVQTEILENKSDLIIDIVSDFFAMIVGDLKQDFILRGETSDDQTEDDFLNKNFELMSQIVKTFISNKGVFNKDKVLTFASNIMNTLYSKIKLTSTSKDLEILQQKFATIMQEIIKLFNFDEKTNLFELIQNLSSSGFQQEKSTLR